MACVGMVMFAQLSAAAGAGFAGAPQLIALLQGNASIEIINAAIAARPGIVNETDAFKRTPLMVACYKDRVDAFNAILAVPGVKVYARVQLNFVKEGDHERDEVDNGKTALHYAAAHSRDGATVAGLLARKLDPNSTDAAQLTPLHDAASMGSPASLSLLLLAGADHENCDRYRQLPLQYAAGSGSLEKVQMLLEAALPEAARMEDKAAMLAAAAVAGSLKCFVNAADRDRNTVLMDAAKSGNLDVVRLLVSLGADENPHDKDGKKAADLALAVGHAAIHDFLVEPR